MLERVFETSYIFFKMLLLNFETDDDNTTTIFTGFFTMVDDARASWRVG